MKSATPENAVSRRQFLLSTCLATTSLGLKPLTGTGAPARESHARADDPDLAILQAHWLECNALDCGEPNQP